MKNVQEKLMKVVAFAGVAATLVTAGVKVYRAIESAKALRKKENALDKKLEASMDCSDATATY